VAAEVVAVEVVATEVAAAEVKDMGCQHHHKQLQCNSNIHHMFHSNMI